MHKRNRSRPAQRPNRTMLALEPLGARIVPAVLVKTFDLDNDGAIDDLRIVGDAQNSTVNLSDNGSNQLTLAIDANGNGSFTDQGDTQQVFNLTGNSVVVEVSMGGGKDTFTYDATSPLNGSTRSFHVNLGNGNDTLQWNMNNHAINNHARVQLDVLMGAGNDTTDINLATVYASLVNVSANLGAGNDTYALNLGVVDQFASVDLATDLGAGANTHHVVIDDVGKFDQATMTVDILGGKNTDNVEVKMLDDVGDGQLASFFSLNANLQGGNDLFKALLHADFRVDDHSQAAFNVLGATGNDTLTVLGESTGILRLDPNALLAISLDGGAGNDLLQSAIIQIIQGVTLDLFGTLRTRLKGGAGNDTISCLYMNSNTSTGVYDIVIKGDTGNDAVTFNILNQGGTVTFGAAAGVLIDGGVGLDTLEAGNPNDVVGQNVEVLV